MINNFVTYGDELNYVPCQDHSSYTMGLKSPYLCFVNKRLFFVVLQQKLLRV